MVNSGCHAEARATEELFVRNFAGFDYIVVPSGKLHSPYTLPSDRRGTDPETARCESEPTTWSSFCTTY